MAKYEVPDDHWEDDEPEGPPAWKEDTSATSIEIDVRLHEQGYQNDEKWTVHCTDRLDEDGVISGYAIKHRNKGNYWRDGERWSDAIDFVDLPLRVRQRVAHVLNRELAEITPETRTIHREDGTGIADRDRDDDPEIVTDGGVEDADKVPPDPEDDPTLCSLCGCYIGHFSDEYCDGCARDIGVKPPMQRCVHCGTRGPEEQMEQIDISGPDEYYPKFEYLCRSCAGGDGR